MIFAGTGGISRHIRENFAPEQGAFSALFALSPAAPGTRRLRLDSPYPNGAAFPAALAFSPLPL
jgi:hypothetical protein